MARPYGRGCSAQVPCGERGVARLCVSRRTALVALVGKVAHVSAVVSRVVVTPLRSAHDSMLVGASGHDGELWSARGSSYGDLLFWPPSSMCGHIYTIYIISFDRRDG